MLTWAELREVFEPDGSLLDVVIESTTVDDWRTVLEFVGSLSKGGVAEVRTRPDPLPPIAVIFASADEPLSLLSVELGRVVANCHFFDATEIEFDVDPRDVLQESDARSLLTFMEGLARAVGRPAHLTAESSHDNRLVTFEPLPPRWTKHPHPWYPTD
jgi:hypothetical protein